MIGLRVKSIHEEFQNKTYVILDFISYTHMANRYDYIVAICLDETDNRITHYNISDLIVIKEEEDNSYYD